MSIDEPKRSSTKVVEQDSALSPHLAFVVQFRTETEIAPERCTGRVEHMVSGQAASFRSLDELWTFMARVLTERRENPRTQ